MSAQSILQVSDFVFGFPLLAIGCSFLHLNPKEEKLLAISTIGLFFIIVIRSLNRHFCPRSPARCWITLFWLGLIFALIPGAIITHVSLLPLTPIIIAGGTLFTLGILAINHIHEAD